jgi:hypothetical protein
MRAILQRKDLIVHLRGLEFYRALKTEKAEPKKARSGKSIGDDASEATKGRRTTPRLE